jgi:hypothetical protein
MIYAEKYMIMHSTSTLAGYTFLILKDNPYSSLKILHLTVWATLMLPPKDLRQNRLQTCRDKKILLEKDETAGI